MSPLPVSPRLPASVPAAAAVAAPVWIRRGTREYRDAGLSLFLLGFASFSLIYCVQPLLPDLARNFHVDPATSSLALSLTTGLLAVSIVFAGAFSQALGRKGLMFVSMILAAGLDLVAATVTEWHALLVARALEGVALGGVPAVAMAWLAEEIDPAHLGKTMGLYVGGTAFGAMMGRVGMGLMTEFASWRVALGGLGVLCLAASLGFAVLLPPSRNFVRKPGFDLGFHFGAWARHLRNRDLIRLYATGFLLTSIFVTLFNYSTFRLAAQPWGFDRTEISLIFLAFGFGIVSSSVAGALADRIGRRPLLIGGFVTMFAGVLLTLMASLVAIVCGIALVTTGFFVGHAVASGAVGPRAGVAKGHAASLYLLFYYMGSSVTGSLGGWVWQAGGWPAVVGMTGAFALVGTGLAVVSIRPRAG